MKIVMGCYDRMVIFTPFTDLIVACIVERVNFYVDAQNANVNGKFEIVMTDSYFIVFKMKRICNKHAAHLYTQYNRVTQTNKSKYTPMTLYEVTFQNMMQCRLFLLLLIAKALSIEFGNDISITFFKVSDFQNKIC